MRMQDIDLEYHERSEYLTQFGWKWNVPVRPVAPKREIRRLYNDELYMLMRPRLTIHRNPYVR